MTHPNAIAQTLERARGLISFLLAEHQAGGAKEAGTTHLRNMLAQVENIEERVTSTDEDTANAIKRLRDFSRIIERLEAKADAALPVKGICQELASSLRSAADQLMAGPVRLTSN